MQKLIEKLKKLKLLLKARKPAENLISQAKELKRGWKKVSFWVSVLGTLLSLVGAVAEIIPPHLSLVITTTLTTFYNMLRGLDKADEAGVRPVLRSTEFWQGALGEISNGIVKAQTGGVDPAWFHTAQAFITSAMVFAQYLGAQQPTETRAEPAK